MGARNVKKLEKPEKPEKPEKLKKRFLSRTLGNGARRCPLSESTSSNIRLIAYLNNYQAQSR
jgi:hypothetical protein